MPIERDSLVARLLAYGTQWNDGKTNGTLFKFSDGSRFFLAEEDAAALSRPEQVVTDEMVSAAYEELRRRLTLHPSRDQVKAALEAACLTTAAPPTNLQQLLEAYDFNGQEWAPKAAAPLQADASAPVSPAIGVQAVKARDAMRHAKSVLTDLRIGQGIQNERFPDNKIEGALWDAIPSVVAELDAALHPAPEAASAGAAGETLAQAEARVMQEYRWGNLTPLGVANHLRRAGFRSQVAVEKANALAPSDTAPSPKGVSDGVLADAARYRWLRDSTGGRSNRWPHVTQYPHQPNIDRDKPPQIMRDGEYRGEYLDEAIDAAMQMPPERLLNEPARLRAAALSQEPVPATAEERAASKEGA